MPARSAQRVMALLLAPVWVCGVGLCSARLRGQAPASAPASATPQAGAPPQEPASPAVPLTPASGATLFSEKGCVYCHGAGAAGTEKGPSLLGVGRRLKPAGIEHQIHDGGGGMPAFGVALTQPEIDALVKYLVTLKKPPVKKPTSKTSGAEAGTR